MEQQTQNRPELVVQHQAGEDTYGLSGEVVEAVCGALDEGDLRGVQELVEPLHYSDAADLLERLGPGYREQVIDILRQDFDPEILTELDETVRDEVIERLGWANLAVAIQELDSDDAVWLIDQLDAEEQERVLSSLPQQTQDIIRQGLSYPEYSAGRLMARELVAVPAYWTVGETIDYLRSNPRLPDEFYDIFVVDPRHRPIGKIRLAKLARSRRPIRLRDIMDSELLTIQVGTDQEEVAFLFRQQDLISAPVVDPAGRLLGVITVDDIVDVIDEEAADDMLRLAGVADTDLYRAVIETTRKRFTWLLVNAFTAVLASAVIGLFDGAIDRLVALAILMPIVASMGGNAGTQTLTVAVRALAMREINEQNAWRIVGKELLVGVTNGILFGVIIGVLAWLWFDLPALGLVMAAAMVINMLMAGLAGALIPLTLDRMKIDPAISSSVFLTTVTDVIGFFAFLGLAAVFLL